MADLSLFGQRIKKLRQELGLSQRDFAEKIGVTASALSSYEKGQKNPSVNVAVNISSSFRVSLDWLCGLKKEDSRFHQDDIIPFDLPSALRSLLDLIHFQILSIPEAENPDEYRGIDPSYLEVSNGCLEDFIRDSEALSDLYANGSISYENFQICMDEIIFRNAEFIRDYRKREVAQREKERRAKSNDDSLPF